MKRATRLLFYKLGKIGDSVVVFVEFLQRVIAWLPILWRDRDWDWGFLMTMMQFKMRRMADCIEDNGLIAGKHRVAKQLRYAVMLGDWAHDAMSHPKVKALSDAYDQKWGDYVWSDELTPAQTELAEKHGSLFLREKIQTEADYEQSQKEFGEYVALWQRTEQDATERFFKHMHTYMKNWWD